MKKSVALLTKKKHLKINGKMMTLTFFELYTVKKSGQFFFHTNLLFNSHKDTSLMLKVINTWTSYKYENNDPNFFLNTMYIHPQSL